MASGTKYIVYKHTNKLNGKVYIGLTSRTLQKRINSGYYDNKAFNDDIVKYGWECFDSIIIARELSKEDAELLEIKLIKEFNSTNPLYGYNKSAGGFKIHKGCSMTKESKNRCRQGSMYIHRGENSPQAKPIIKLSPNGEILARYPSIGEAERQEGAYKGSIQRVLLGLRKTYKNNLYVYDNKGGVTYR